jgi:hypothetical protein
MLMPEPEVESVRAATVVDPVLAIIPLDAASSDPLAPFNVRTKLDCAPLSVIPMPVVADTYRLFASVGSWLTVRNV